MYRIRPLYKNKFFGFVLLAVSLFGFMVIAHRLASYVFEYDAQYSPIDYGTYNILSYFTVQSNIFVCIYLLISAFAVFGSEKCRDIAFNPYIGALVTTYILVTGVTYCAGIPMGFTPPYKWDTPMHSMSAFIQIFHHMIIPPFMLILWFFPATNRTALKNRTWIFGIYPALYIAFSLVRGAVAKPEFYPYPFFKPDFMWNLLFEGKELNLIYGYLLLIPLIIVGMLVFFAVGRLMLAINRKRAK